MNRRDLLQLMGAGMIGGAIPLNTQLPEPDSKDFKPTSSEDDYIWGDIWLPVILDALGIPAAFVNGVKLHFEYGEFLSALINYEDGTEQTYIVTRFGTCVVSGVLGLPRGVQAVTVHIHKAEFVIAECRYAPIDVGSKAFVAALKADDGEIGSLQAFIPMEDVQG